MYCREISVIPIHGIKHHTLKLKRMWKWTFLVTEKGKETPFAGNGEMRESCNGMEWTWR